MIALQDKNHQYMQTVVKLGRIPFIAWEGTSCPTCIQPNLGKCTAEAHLCSFVYVPTKWPQDNGYTLLVISTEG